MFIFAVQLMMSDRYESGNLFHTGVYLWPLQVLVQEVCINETDKGLPQLVKWFKIQQTMQSRLPSLLGNKIWTEISTCTQMSETEPEVRRSKWWAPICYQNHPEQRKLGWYMFCTSLPWKEEGGWDRKYMFFPQSIFHHNYFLIILSIFIYGLLFYTCIYISHISLSEVCLFI